MPKGKEKGPTPPYWRIDPFTPQEWQQRLAEVAKSLDEFSKKETHTKPQGSRRLELANQCLEAIREYISIEAGDVTPTATMLRKELRPVKDTASKYPNDRGALSTALASVSFSASEKIYQKVKPLTAMQIANALDDDEFPAKEIEEAIADIAALDLDSIEDHKFGSRHLVRLLQYVVPVWVEWTGRSTYSDRKLPERSFQTWLDAELAKWEQQLVRHHLDRLKADLDVVLASDIDQAEKDDALKKKEEAELTIKQRYPLSRPPGIEICNKIIKGLDLKK